MTKQSAYLILDIETTGLSPWYGDKITCICAKAVGGNIDYPFAEAGDNEEEIITKFLHFAGRHSGKTFITKNGKGFDVPFIIVRTILKNIATTSSIAAARE